MLREQTAQFPNGSTISPLDKQDSWDSREAPCEGLVTGTPGLRLYLKATGPLRKQGQPVVIFESGLNVSGAGWLAVQRLLDGRIRSYSYDRAGYGRSPPINFETYPRNASNMAVELRDILKVAGMEPPFVIVAHSYGAIIARELLAAMGPGDIVGFVLVDANQEETYQRIHEPLESMRLLGDAQATTSLTRGTWGMPGLLRDDRSKFTPAELNRIALDAGAPAAFATFNEERALMSESSIALAQKRQLETQILGMYPVTVIRGDSGRDLRKSLSDVKPSTHDEDGRKAMVQAQDFLNTNFDKLDHGLQLQQLRLLADCRFVQAKDSGHNVMASEPELVAEEIRSVWESSQLWC